MSEELEKNEAPILDQVRPHWQKICAVLLHYLAQARGVDQHAFEFLIDEATVAGLSQSWPGGATVLVHGRPDGILLKLITEDAAMDIMRYQDAQKPGNA